MAAVLRQSDNASGRDANYSSIPLDSTSLRLAVDPVPSTSGSWLGWLGRREDPLLKVRFLRHLLVLLCLWTWR